MLTYVVPTYNNAETIGRCVLSLVEQPGFEGRVIVVDDGSTDRTRETVDPYRGRIDYIYQENSGPCAARNAGLARVDTEAVCFVDADDYAYGPHYLAVQRNWRQDIDTLVGLAGEEKNNHLYLSIFNKYRDDPSPVGMLRRFMRDDCVQTSTLVWSVPFLRRLGGWNTALYSLNDIDLAFRAFAAGARVGLSHDHAWVVWCHRPGSISRVLTARSADSHVLSLQTLAELLSQMSATDTDWALFRDRCGSTARSLFLNGYSRQAAAILELGRRHGLATHPGPFLERQAAWLLGSVNVLSMRRHVGVLRRRVRQWRVSGGGTSLAKSFR